MMMMMVMMMIHFQPTAAETLGPINESTNVTS